MDRDNKHLPAHVPRDLTHVLKLTNAAVNFTTVTQWPSVAKHLHVHISHLKTHSESHK